MKPLGIGDRMKRYEFVTTSHILQPRTPAIIRVDGKAFHTLTRGCDKPFDERLIHAMAEVAAALVDQVQNAKIAYVQSDEVSVLMTDYMTFNSQPWFGGEIQKIASVAASIATASFTQGWGEVGLFDGRVFALPSEEVCNYFLWRQRDWERNSVAMLAQAHFSPKQLHGKNIQEQKQMVLEQYDICWEHLPEYLRRGRAFTPSGEMSPMPVFSQERHVIDELLVPQQV